MKTDCRGISGGRRAGILGAAFLVTCAAWANPIVLPAKPVAPEVTFLLGSAILLEVACVWMVLRRWGKPRLFLLWLIGMHALTYPGFMALLSALDELRPASAAMIGETVVVVVEGAIIYVLCRFLRPRRSGVPAPSALRCWLASLVGNLCSVAAFPILSAAFERFGPR
jgi:hypothetical protein